MKAIMSPCKDCREESREVCFKDCELLKTYRELIGINLSDFDFLSVGSFINIYY